MSDILLDARNRNTYYGHIHALKGISIKTEKGNFVSIIGANGAGKSTLLKTIMGLVKAESGQIIYDQKDITKLPTHTTVKYA
jgi:branched-chain amino acid transport system ATP-binding protein